VTLKKQSPLFLTVVNDSAGDKEEEDRISERSGKRVTDKWREYRWGDLATLEYGKGLCGYKDSIGTYPVYGTNGLIGRHTEPLCPHSGVIIGRKGAYRGVHYSEKPFFVIDTAFYLEPKADIDLKWAYYQLLTQNINNMDSGSAIPSTSRDAFYNLPVKVPSLPEQKTIALILGALDDKIELNRQMNETLEAMARAIFKSWFVDFDPISGFGPHKEWQDSPLGKIPKGWKVARVSDAFEINPSRQIKKGIQYAHVDMASLPTTSARVTKITRREFTGSGSKFKNGDVLFARITPCLENGKTALVDFLPENEYGWGSTEFIVFRPKEPLNPWFVYCVARNQEFRDHAIRAMSGTSGRQRVEIGCFNNFSGVMPPAEITAKFGDIVKPWFTQMKINDEQSHTLVGIRDALLPKLLLGEIRVKGTERFVEAAS